MALRKPPPFSRPEPARTAIDALPGMQVLEFGTDWCGFCRAAQPLVAEALAAHPEIGHLRVEDGSGRPLGRSFKVKLWPTFVFLAKGREVARLVRPGQLAAIEEALATLECQGDVSGVAQDSGAGV